MIKIDPKRKELGWIPDSELIEELNSGWEELSMVLARNMLDGHDRKHQQLMKCHLYLTEAIKAVEAIAAGKDVGDTAGEKHDERTQEK